jgi:hypothetical protein
MQFGENPFVSFEVTMTEKERHQQLTKLEQEIKSLQHAISIKDPALRGSTTAKLNVSLFFAFYGILFLKILISY